MKTCRETKVAAREHILLTILIRECCFLDRCILGLKQVGKVQGKLEKKSGVVPSDQSTFRDLEGYAWVLQWIPASKGERKCLVTMN